MQRSLPFVIALTNMCIRNTYHCLECQTSFAIPLKKWRNSSWYNTWILCHCCCDTDWPISQEPVQDQLCNNKHCLRRTEEGYKACLGIQDECYYCIRYGHLGQCFNKRIYVPCETCYYWTWDKRPNANTYNVLFHYRRVQTPDPAPSLLPSSVQ